MKILIFLTPLILMTVQVFLPCNCQINLVPIYGNQNFSLSSSTMTILKSADATNSKVFKSILEFGSTMSAPITAVTKQTNTSDLAKNVITNNIENDITIIMNALNSIGTSLAGCKPQTSYPNDLDISTSCFAASCSSTGIQCQALYLQIAIDELTIALNTATYNLNLTSSSLVGSGWTFSSLSTLTTQWSIVQASAAYYQTSTKTGPLIKTVNSSFKRVLGAALSGTNLFLTRFESGYKTLNSALNVTSYNQTFDDYSNLIILSTTSSAIKSELTKSFMLDGIILKASPVQSSISGISISSFVRPVTIFVFDSLAALSSSFNSDLSNFQTNMNSLIAEQQQSLTNLIVSTRKKLNDEGYYYKNDQKTTNTDINQCVAGTSVRSSYSNWLNDNFQTAQTSTTDLIINYTSLISSYTNMAIDCFKVGCTGNTIYPYSLWKLQCVNDFSFTSFCWNSESPGTFQRCPSAKAQALNACLDDVSSLITSLQPASDMEMILDDVRRSFDPIVDQYTVAVSSGERGLCVYTRLY